MTKTNVAYRWAVAPDADTPITAGEYEILLVNGGTYRNLASRRKYTIVDMYPEREEIKYQYTRAEGETVTRTGQPNELAVVEAVDGSPGGIISAPGEVRTRD